MTDDAEVIELRKKIAQAEKRLSENERLLSESKQRTAETKQRLANLEKAKAALMKFYARGPHTKKKSGRPGFWVTPDGCSFVWEVERFKKKRKCKTAFAIIQVRKKTIRSANQLKARGIKSPIIARAARLERLANDASLRRGYEDARRFWLFMVDPEAYRQEEAALQYNFEQALAALQGGTPARNPLDFSRVEGRTRNPYDFS
jgi:hypothetical protein